MLKVKRLLITIWSCQFDPEWGPLYSSF